MLSARLVPFATLTRITWTPTPGNTAALNKITLFTKEYEKYNVGGGLWGVSLQTSSPGLYDIQNGGSGKTLVLLRHFEERECSRDTVVSHLFACKTCPFCFYLFFFLCYRLCQSKQSKVYLPEAPFPHAEVNVDSKWLKLPYKQIFISTENLARVLLSLKKMFGRQAGKDLRDKTASLPEGGHEFWARFLY